MQSDDVIWQIVNYQFCSFKAKLARERAFCQNPYNVTGLCLRSACPLANSSYATIREIDGISYLFIKTAERAHTPKKLWEKIKLPANYTQALALVSKELEHYPKYLVHRNKQRLTKIHQMIIRMRKLKLKARPKIVTTSTKVDRREIIRERKALKAAQIDKAIENELLERLKQVSETEIYNYPEKQYTNVISRISKNNKELEKESVDENDDEFEQEGGEVENNYNDEVDNENDNDDDIEDDDEMEDEEVFNQSLMDRNYNIEYVEDVEESDDEDIEDIDMYPIISTKKNDSSKSKKTVRFTKDNNKKRKTSEGTERSKNKGIKKAHIEIEYEEETEDARKSLQTIRQYDF